MNTNNYFVTAFNNGYTLAKYEPELLETVTKNLSPTNEYLEGLFEGKKRYVKEYTQEKITDLENLRNQREEKARICTEIFSSFRE